jgi:hypothetical protein
MITVLIGGFVLGLAVGCIIIVLQRQIIKIKSQTGQSAGNTIIKMADNLDMVDKRFLPPAQGIVLDKTKLLMRQLGVNLNQM